MGNLSFLISFGVKYFFKEKYLGFELIFEIWARVDEFVILP